MSLGGSVPNTQGPFYPTSRGRDGLELLQTPGSSRGSFPSRQAYDLLQDPYTTLCPRSPICQQPVPQFSVFSPGQIHTRLLFHRDASTR